MTTERITPAANCRYCGGSGRTRQPHGERTACQCVLDQMQDDDAKLIIDDDDSDAEWRDD